MQNIENLSKEKLVEACQTALECFRKIYNALEEGVDGEEILENDSCWPLSLLRYALGNETAKEQAEENWNEGCFIGGDEEDDD